MWCSSASHINPHCPCWLLTGGWMATSRKRESFVSRFYWFFVDSKRSKGAKLRQNGRAIFQVALGQTFPLPLLLCKLSHSNMDLLWTRDKARRPHPQAGCVDMGGLHHCSALSLPFPPHLENLPNVDKQFIHCSTEFSQSLSDSAMPTPVTLSLQKWVNRVQKRQ